MSNVRVALAVEQFVLVVLVDLAVHPVPVANSSSTVLAVPADLVVRVAPVAIAIVHVDLFARTALVAIPTCLAARSVLAATSNYPFVVFGLTVVFFLVKFFLCFVRIFR